MSPMADICDARNGAQGFVHKENRKLICLKQINESDFLLSWIPSLLPIPSNPLLFGFGFEIGSCYISYAGLDLEILLCLPPDP